MSAEDELIAALADVVKAPVQRRIVVGIGDDAAVWQPSRSHVSVITTDALVDGVHFVRAAMEAGAIGHRALASNLSDIAAMGARPVLATVALGLPAGTTRQWVTECYRGMAVLAAAHDTRIVGGDIVRSPALTLSLTVVGEVARSKLRRRSGGRPGDVVAVTGPVGLSRAGLVLTLQPRLNVDAAARSTALTAFATPTPRLREGRWLAASTHVHAMMDVSDGVSTDLGRLAAASACGATLDPVTPHPVVRAVAQAAGDDAEHYALDGGEDFELLACIAPRAFQHLAGRFAGRFGRPLIAIGRLERHAGLRLETSTGPRPLVAGGFDHLAPASFAEINLAGEAAD